MRKIVTSILSSYFRLSVAFSKGRREDQVGGGGEGEATVTSLNEKFHLAMKKPQPLAFENTRGK